MAAPVDHETCDEDNFPIEIQDRLNDFDEALTRIETCINPLLSTPFSEVQENLSPLDKAKIDLISAYTINSLFWMYLNVKGINPKEHRVKQELGGIRQYMSRAKQIQDKALAPKIDLPVTNRFIKNALWAQAKKDAEMRKEAEELAANSTQAAKKALWKAALSQSRQESAGTSTSGTDSSPAAKKMKKDIDGKSGGKHGKKNRKR
ncbi:nuclear nucleic acid-binding protein C1D-like [Lineus longissimus]|uniref:nuclear nucleic acid-binding protein C1D-like n=1 Tax=Lineus longissimus TaxID=88925 RepID=UPI00315DA999